MHQWKKFNKMCTLCLPWVTTAPNVPGLGLRADPVLVDAKVVSSIMEQRHKV